MKKSPDRLDSLEKIQYTVSSRLLKPRKAERAGIMNNRGFFKGVCV